MAVDKAVDAGAIDDKLESIADAIRTVANTLDNFQAYQNKEYTMEEMATALRGIASIINGMDANGMAF